MKKYKIYYKEWGREPSSTTHEGFKTPEELVEFFGLNEPDVEWYKIEEV